MKIFNNRLLVLGFSAFLTATAHAGVLLSDNFDNNLLNTNLWTANTSLADGSGTPTLVVANQRCEITARAYLDTVTNYDPASLGGLMISGTWTIVSGDTSDLPTVVTRCSGIPTAYLTYSGEPTAGVQFRLNLGSPAGISIYSGYAPANITGFTVVSNTLNAGQGDTLTFQATDDGTNLSFYVVKNGNSAQAAFATAVCTNQFGTNKITFYNREFSADTLAVDNVVVQTGIPSAPQLNLLSAPGNQSLLFWPMTATNYFLQSVTNLSSTNWVTVTDAVQVMAFTVSNGAPARFFRLQSQ